MVLGRFTLGGPNQLAIQGRETREWAVLWTAGMSSIQNEKHGCRPCMQLGMYNVSIQNCLMPPLRFSFIGIIGCCSGRGEAQKPVRMSHTYVVQRSLYVFNYIFTYI